MCPFQTTPDLRDDLRQRPDVPPVWVRPTVAVEVECRQRVRDGLRHAALKGVRSDKRPSVTREESPRRSGTSIVGAIPVLGDSPPKR